MRSQGYNANGEPYSSAYVQIDRANPKFYCDCSNLPSLTRQEFAADCDINTLMSRYEKTGVINHFNKSTPQYLDISETPDLQNALTILAEANAAFMRLPAKTRREFDNDPVKFVDFASDEKNIAQMREWGLAEPLPITPEPMKVEVVNPPTDKSAP